MPDRNLTYQDLLQIVELVKSSSQFSEFHLKAGDIEVDLKRGSTAGVPVPGSGIVETAKTVPPAPRAGETVTSPEKTAEEHVHRAHQRHRHVGGGEIVTEAGESGISEGQAAPRVLPMGFPDGAILVKSPMVGTFYRAPEPGAHPFVEVGQRVTPDTVLCIIEVMKLMNSIPARHSGVVTHILIEDAQPVEFGQVLMVIDPDGSEAS